VKRSRVSAADVAEEAEVSRTTVSFVLNNTPGKHISEQTRQRVLEAAARLGYEPNQDARRLAMLRNRAIGLFICHSQYVYTDAFIVRTIEGMSQAVNRHRVRLVIQPLSLREQSYLALAERDQVDGIILINTHEDDPALTEVIDAGFPAVSLDYLENRSVDQVYVDNRAAGREMVDYLLTLGHRRIAMITHAPVYFSASKMRLQGYYDALEARRVPVPEGMVVYGDFSEESGYQGMRALLGRGEAPTAVFAGNDVVAYGAMTAIKEANLSIPDDISLVGFDDDYLSRYLNPPLTTMALPAAGMGSAAAALLVDRLDRAQGSMKPQSHVLPTHISIRSSCRRLNEE
jgi:LacI family transcriptional regulator